MGIPLAAVLVTPWIFYVASSIGAARSMRIRYALQRNATSARLGARVIDAQCGRAATMVRLLAGRVPAGQIPNSVAAELRTDVRRVVGALPDLAFAGVYDATGRSLAAYPAANAPAGRAQRPGWFRRASREGGPVFCGIVQVRSPGPDLAIVLAMAVRRSGSPHRFVVAYYQLDSTRRWLQSTLSEDEVTTLVLLPDGRELVMAKGASTPTVSGLGKALSASLQSARTRTLTYRADGKEDPVLVGFEYARVPRWIIAVCQPLSGALASTDYLLLRLSLLYVPTAVLVVWGLVTLASLRRGQALAVQQLATQNEQLLVANRAKTDFLDNVSHDLLTPLASVQLVVSGLLDPTVSWTRLQMNERLQIAQTEIEQLTARVRNLLEMTRLDADVDRSQKVPCDLAEIIGSCQDRLQVLLAGRKVDLMLAPVPLLFLGRAAQIEIVVTNMIENAIKYSPAGSPLLVRAGVRDTDVYFALRDEGPGVQPGDAALIFEKFQRRLPRGPMGGMGLGLAISKRIVEGHGGLIGVVNIPGAGAEFWFSIPALPAHRGAAV